MSLILKINLTLSESISCDTHAMDACYIYSICVIHTYVCLYINIYIYIYIASHFLKLAKTNKVDFLFLFRILEQFAIYFSINIFYRPRKVLCGFMIPTSLYNDPLFAKISYLHRKSSDYICLCFWGDIHILHSAELVYCWITCRSEYILCLE